MKKFLLSFLLATVCGFGFLSAQTNPIPEKGDYKLNKKWVNTATLPPTPIRTVAEVYSTDTDYMKVGVDWDNRRNTQMDYYGFLRLKDDVFAPSSDGYFLSPITYFAIVKPDNVISLYQLNASQSEIEEVIVMAPEGSKWKSLRKAAEASSEEFPLAAMIALAPTVNEEKKARIEAEEKAAAEEKARIIAEKKAAAEKAEAERRAAAQAKEEAEMAARKNADLCTPMKRYMGMASSNFAEIKGKLDPVETEYEEEDVFFTTETPPLFEVGRLMPNLFDPNKKELSLYTKMFRTKAEAETEMNYIKSKLLCFGKSDGYKVYEDSGLHFYEKGSMKFYIFTKMDLETDNYFVQLKMKK